MLIGHQRSVINTVAFLVKHAIKRRTIFYDLFCFSGTLGFICSNFTSAPIVQYNTWCAARSAAAPTSPL